MADPARPKQVPDSLDGSWCVVSDENQQPSPNDFVQVTEDPQLDSPDDNEAEASAEASTSPSLSSSVPNLPSLSLALHLEQLKRSHLSQSQHMESGTEQRSMSASHEIAGRSVDVWGTPDEEAPVMVLGNAIPQMQRSPPTPPSGPERGRWWGEQKEPPSPAINPEPSPRDLPPSAHMAAAKESKALVPAPSNRRDDDMLESIWHLVKILMLVGGGMYVGNKIYRRLTCQKV